MGVGHAAADVVVVVKLLVVGVEVVVVAEAVVGVEVVVGEEAVVEEVEVDEEELVVDCVVVVGTGLHTMPSTPALGVGGLTTVLR